MSAHNPDRRAFLRQAGLGAAAVATCLPTSASAAGEVPPKRVVSGSPRERGRAYGRLFKDGIAAFLDKEIYAQFIKKPSPKDELLRYAGACGKVVREVCPVVHD